MWILHYFCFEKNYDILKSKSLWFLLSKNINFSKNKTELEIKNPMHSFREMSFVLQLV